ncbi:MAG: 2-(1,2-epoxy-1,2-dihydrophenyl)acetyl-CoA isomerase [Rhodocyclaceae bacterium]|nr:2-(1,2-epoxy-1,2-dihydrophenyl)acetyl-CoA isomerase [Rhodocyclaceae bacterium]
MNYSSIVYSFNDSISTVQLNRPEKLNSLTRPMLLELRDSLAQSKKDGARVLLIQGSGRGFCAGQDLSEHDFSHGPDNLNFGQLIDELYAPLIADIHALDIPVVAAVNGMAAGAGASLALACDLVVATRSAYFLQAFCKIGLIPDAGGTWFLPRLVGNSRAMGLAMLGERLSASDAADWGLIWRCVDDDSFAAEINALTLHLSKAPTRAMAFTKHAIYAAANNTLAAQIALEAKYQDKLGKSNDLLEGASAFLQKRPAKFTGT